MSIFGSYGLTNFSLCFASTLYKTNQSRSESVPATATLADDLKSLARLDVLNDVCRGHKIGTEENIKLKIVLPVLEWLCYDRVKDMDFEFHVQNKRADVALLIEGKPKVIVETKSLEKDLDDWKVKSLQYCKGKAIGWLLLSNGEKFQLYKSWIEDVEDSRNRPIYEGHLRHLPETFATLERLIGHQNLKDIDTKEEVKARVESVRRAVTEEVLLETLREGKRKLFADILPQLTEKYARDQKFRAKIDRWVGEKAVDTEETWLTRYRQDKNFKPVVDKLMEADGLRVNESFIKKYTGDRLFRNQIDEKLRLNDIHVDWLDKICAEGAYTFINRILFLRICEDRGHITLRTSREWVETLRSASFPETVVSLLKELFAEVGAKSLMYSKPLFDHIMLEDLTWKKETVVEIIERTKKHNFKTLDRDLLGEVYQKHISKEVRKSLGQFYTPDELINHILDQIDLTSDMKLADISCGSGTFLKLAYERLFEKMTKVEKWDPASAHTHLMSSVLYGIDIDSFAAQLTMMNLLLIDLENPSPKMNVYEWDSLRTALLSHSTQSSEESVWETSKAPTEILDSESVNAAVGNPPYVVVRRDNPLYADELKGYYTTVLSGPANTSTMFVRRCIDITKESGRIGLVLPKSLTWVDSYAGIRKHILQNCSILSITDIGRGFEDVGFEMVTMVMRKDKDRKKRDGNSVNAITDIKDLASHSYEQASIPQSLFEEVDTFSIYLSGQMKDIAEKMLRGSKRLTDIADIWRGLPTSVNDPMIKEAKTQADQEPMLQGKSVFRYQTKGSLFASPHYFEAEYPAPVKRLRVKKIVLQRLVSSQVKANATYDEKALLNIDTITNVKVHELDFDEKYVLGILNSKLGTLFIRDVVFNRAILTMDMDKSYLGKVPVKVANSRTQADITTKVDELLVINSKLTGMGYDLFTATEYNPLEEKRKALDASLEEDIFDLYELNEVQKAFVRKSVTY